MNNKKKLINDSIIIYLTKNNQRKNISKKINYNVKYTITSNKRNNKEHIPSDLKKGKIRQELMKSNQISESFNSSHKKKFETINSIVANYIIYDPDLISILIINKSTETDTNFNSIKPKYLH